MRLSHSSIKFVLPITTASCLMIVVMILSQLHEFGSTLGVKTNVPNLLINPTNETSLTAKQTPELIPLVRNNSNPPIVTAEIAIAIDRNSYTPLYEKSARIPTAPASTTKLVTALVALDTYAIDDQLYVPIDIVTAAPGSTAGLAANDQIQVHDLLYALLIGSANDAAYTLAINDPNGYESFIDKMNRVATDLHLTQTHFSNAIGYDAPDQYVSGFDLAVIADRALKNPTIAKIVDTKEYNFTSAINSKQSYTVKNTNTLLGTISGVHGVKTGFTTGALGVLITYVNRNDHEIIVVVMRSQNREDDMRRIIDWVYDTYQW